MEPARLKPEVALLKSKLDAARMRLSKAQHELTSVLEQLADLPLGLKTGVMRAIETAFEELKQAELHVIEMHEFVLGQAPQESA